MVEVKADANVFVVQFQQIEPITVAAENGAKAKSVVLQADTGLIEEEVVGDAKGET